MKEVKINELNLNGYKHIKNNEWSYPNDLLDYLFDHGFKRQGKGHFSEVWASDTEKFVVKINMGKNYDENYLKFVDYCHRNKGNPHLPKMGQLKQMTTPDGKNFYILFIEKLKPVTPDMLGFANSDDYYSFMGATAISIINGFEWETDAIINSRCDEYNILSNSLRKQFQEMVKIYADMIELVGMHNMDIETKNVMLRGDNCFVITDPVY